MLLEVPITKKMNLSVTNLDGKYQTDLKVKRKLTEQEVACKRQLEAYEQH